MNIERNYLRRSYRINLPAYANIENEKYLAKDWSFLGFRIDTKGKKFQKDVTYDVLFELPFAGFDMRFKTKAICKWSSNTEAGFEFTDLSDEIKLVMKEYVEAYIEGRLQNTEGLLKIAEGIEIPIDTSAKLSPSEKKKLDKALIKRVIIYLALFILVIFAAFKIYKNKNLVYSSEAFISGNYYTILSPINGVIKKINVTIGEKITKNTLVAVIQNNDLIEKINELNQTKSLLYSQLKELNTILNNIKKPSIDKSLVDEIKRLITKKENYLKKQKKLFKLGLTDLNSLQKTESEIDNLKLKLKIINSDNNDLTYTQLKNNLKLSILNIQNKIKKLDFQINTLKSQLKYEKVFSPYSGTVLNIYKKRYDTINKSSPLATINIDTSKIYVIGRFKYKDALNVYINDKAEIFIPSLNKTYKGVVAAIGSTALNGTVPNDTAAYTRKDIPIKIEILNPDKKLMPGIAAEITIVGN
jgi:multidrug resistance efflux pump